jgi:hypothetical protein
VDVGYAACQCLSWIDGRKNTTADLNDFMTLFLKSDFNRTKNDDDGL